MLVSFHNKVLVHVCSNHIWSCRPQLRTLVSLNRVRFIRTFLRIRRDTHEVSKVRVIRRALNESIQMGRSLHFCGQDTVT